MFKFIPVSTCRVMLSVVNFGMAVALLLLLPHLSDVQTVIALVIVAALNIWIGIRQFVRATKDAKVMLSEAFDENRQQQSA